MDLELESQMEEILTISGSMRGQYFVFIDLEKVYDSVWRERMSEVAEHYGVPLKIVGLLRNWYVGVRSYVRVEERSDWFRAG